MQQTPTYKLNLIETSDTFSPAPLNENTQKVETQLNAVRAETSADTAALEQRVAVLEARKVAIGTYTGTYSGSGVSPTQTISVGFDPIFVMAAPIGNIPHTAVPGQTGNLEIIPGGFQVRNAVNRGTFNYVAVC